MKGAVLKYCIVWLGLIFLVGAFLLDSPQEVFAESNIKIQVNGQQVNMDVSPIIINGRTMVPLRPIFEALDAEVSWDESTKTVSGKKGDIVVILQIDNKQARVNERNIIMEVPAIIVNDSTMVPARFIAESLGASVVWNSQKKTVEISLDKNTENYESIILSKDFFIPSLNKQYIFEFQSGNLKYNVVEQWSKDSQGNYIQQQKELREYGSITLNKYTITNSSIELLRSEKTSLVGGVRGDSLLREQIGQQRCKCLSFVEPGLSWSSKYQLQFTYMDVSIESYNRSSNFVGMDTITIMGQPMKAAHVVWKERKDNDWTTEGEDWYVKGLGLVKSENKGYNDHQQYSESILLTAVQSGTI